ncbi:hypothetical protein COCSUDRAFT_32332 [Coccomyxa subellipsoidea C-169]|uniref:Uncharacterized protein n=1 Tax=Coccomyxa subellipsoidea (strain C-169) TaxID=574566 RepID=I0Z4R9_COCSC|nr:hypothetical protein COCSUDRAFT_32332 [Coccomyxa subellipsoidea C-169]EIE25638.1 hypothetical protein COCSUDRAFT_32332 [Coccomyxa subellipsoidea C-169]|eukprot:XP_005650182.1 hypothetical protein COCSUDRAFT_32332 [Coccomyxa subellipsoidea C-169]
MQSCKAAPQFSKQHQARWQAGAICWLHLLATAAGFCTLSAMQLCRFRPVKLFCIYLQQDADVLGAGTANYIYA